MTKRRHRSAWCSCFFGMLLLCILVARPAVLAEAPSSLSEYALIPRTRLFLNSRSALPSESRAVLFSFTPPATAVYSFASFNATIASGLRGTLFEDISAEPLDSEAGNAQGGNFLISRQLSEGVSYTLLVTSAASFGARAAEIQVMRSAYGHSFGKPINLSVGAVRYGKTLSKPREVHWYRYTASRAGLYTFKTESASAPALDTQGHLYTPEGALSLENDDAAPGEKNFSLRAELAEEQSVLLRVSALSNATGAYQLVVISPDANNTPASALTLLPERAELAIGQRLQIESMLSPANAYPNITFVSSDPAIASVSPAGLVRAHAPGSATVTATAYGGASSSVALSVRTQAVSGVAFEEEAALPLRIEAKTQYALSFAVFPENATHRGVQFSSSNPDVALVDDYGVVTGVAVGSAVISVTTEDGGYTDSIPVEILMARPVYRLLVLGEQHYGDGRTRIGAVNTAQGVLDTFSQSRHHPHGRMQLDSTRAQFIEAIRTSFRRAEYTDVSILYINCHGGYTQSGSYLELHDGSRITAHQLFSILNEIPGRIALILDCCASGGFIGKAAQPDRFHTGILSAFGANSGSTGSPLLNGKFHVLTSASFDQDSWRVSYDAEQTEAFTTTAFARSLCEGAGWDVLKDRPNSLKADFNKDRALTLTELYLYAKRRVFFYLASTSAHQSVQMFPEGSSLLLFQK